MSYELKDFYKDNLPYYHNIGQIANEIRKQHMPNYKTRHFVEDYHTNTVDTIHNIDNLEENIRKIIFNMYDVNRYNRKRFGSSKTNDDEFSVEYEFLKEAFIKHFYIPLLEKSKNESTSENP